MRRIIFVLAVFLLSSLAPASYAGWTEPVFVDSTDPLSPPWNAIEARNDSIYIIYNFFNFIRSTDGGSTWGQQFVQSDGGGWLDTGFKLQGDTLVMFYNDWGHGLDFYYSTDFGETWQGPVIPDYEPSEGSDPFSGNWHNSQVSMCLTSWINPDDSTEILLKSSTDFGANWDSAQPIWTYEQLVYPILYYFYGCPYILSTSYSGGAYPESAIRLLFSTDDGQSWTHYDTLTEVGPNWEQRMDASSQGYMAFVYHEWNPWFLTDSRVLTCLSSDSGITWSAPIDISYQEENRYPCVGVSGDTVVVAWHGNLYPDSVGTGILVTRSYDFGQTWEPFEIAAGPYAVYPEIKIEGGKIHLIYVGDDEGLYYRRWESETGVEEEVENPKRISILGNYPNPFNALTMIKYGLPEVARVTIKIYDLLGRNVATILDANQQAGFHTIAWDASDFPSGVYFARLNTREGSESIKMVLLK